MLNRSVSANVNSDRSSGFGLPIRKAVAVRFKMHPQRFCYQIVVNMFHKTHDNLQSDIDVIGGKGISGT
jgi:hypothetical protein